MPTVIDGVTTYDVLNLGAGRQSTTVYLLSRDGELPWFDLAIFADTQEEPQWVYDHLEWLNWCDGPPILVRTIGKLGDDLVAGRNAAGNSKKTIGGDGTMRFASVPFYTARHHSLRGEGNKCSEGRVHRQCTRDYKVNVVEQAIRRDLLCLKPRQRIPKGVLIRQHFGISLDEKLRAKRILKRFEELPRQTCHFPLIERGWRVWDCMNYLKDKVPHEVKRSACVFCPMRSPEEWADIKRDHEAFRRAVEVDAAIRSDGSVANRGMDQALYAHRRCIPLPLVDIEGEAEKAKKNRGVDLFNAYGCDEGMCGV